MSPRATSQTAALSASVPMQDLTSLADDAAATLDLLLREVMANIRADIVKDGKINAGLVDQNNMPCMAWRGLPPMSNPFVN